MCVCIPREINCSKKQTKPKKNKNPERFFDTIEACDVIIVFSIYIPLA